MSYYWPHCQKITTQYTKKEIGILHDNYLILYNIFEKNVQLRSVNFSVRKEKERLLHANYFILTTLQDGPAISSCPK